MAIDALLFDLDGTLIDSMPLHQKAWGRLHARLGLPFDDAAFFAATAGRANEEILVELVPQASAAERDALSLSKEEDYRALAAEELALIAGTLELKAAARARGLRLAICTAAPPANIAVAEQRFGLGGLVDTVACPADGLRGKPHPDIFLEAARRLGLEPARCVVFEDAPLGVEAARRAGMPAVALTTTMPPEAFAGFPNVIGIHADLTAIDLDRLAHEAARFRDPRPTAA
jgi:HAD superfamily hydrolase (TIGR01509 family)